MQLWHNATTGPGKAFWDKTVADFQAANPNVKIKIQAIQNEDLDGKLQTALNSGSAPGHLPAARRRQDGRDGRGRPADGPHRRSPPRPSRRSATARSRPSARRQGLRDAVDVLPGGFFYSKDLFKKAGITRRRRRWTSSTRDVDQAQGAGSRRSPSAPRTPGRPPLVLLLRAARVQQGDARRRRQDKTFDDPCWTKAGKDLRRSPARSRSTRAS
jgi:raffinose/stachyose/melibiose transport system substrate-binding protein